MALLSHYYQPDIPEGIDEMAMADWIDVLRELPQQAVDDAVTEWLRNETRRPTPAHIRERARARIAPSKKPPPIPDDPDWPFVESKKVISLDRAREIEAEFRAARAKKESEG